jgi:hypothetical protein
LDEAEETTVTTEFDDEINKDMEEVDKEIEGIDESETASSVTNDTVEENALEETPSNLLEENGNDVLAEDIETSNASTEGQEVQEETSETGSSDNLGDVETDNEIEEFLDDKSDKSTENSVEVVAENSQVQEDGQSNVSGEGESEKENDQEDFDRDDEILENDQENASMNSEEALNAMLEEQEEEQTDTVEPSDKVDESSEAISGFNVSEHMEMKSEASPNDSIDELFSEISEAEKVTDLSATSEFHDELHNAMEQAIKDNPKAKTIMVVKFDKDDKNPVVEHLDVEDYKEEFYNRQGHSNHKSVEEILTESMSGTKGHSTEIKPALDAPILDDKPVADKLKEEADALIVPTDDNKGPEAGVLDGSLIKKEDYLKFEHESLKDAIEEHAHHGHHNNRIVKRNARNHKTLTKSEELKEQGTQAQDVYLSSHEKMHNALRMFAEHDALKRAMTPIPKGKPANVFLSDLMGISGVGDHKPSYNMIKYYGGLSEFHSHFAEKAKRQISFEDIDTLIGLLSDMNGIFTTIYDLLPQKDEIEGEKDNKLGKSILDHAYDILRFYSQVRGFINTVVFNRHLLIQDIRFIRSRVNDLHTDMDDMLYFYSMDVQFMRVKTLGKKYSFDPKIEGFLKRIDDISVGFGIDVKTILRSFFHFEKAVVFFDNDTRQLATNINVSTPLDAIRTVDSVIMYLIRIIELKIDIFRSLANLKTSMENMGKYRTQILDNLRGAEQLIHYYTVNEESALLPRLGALVLMVFVFFRED